MTEPCGFICYCSKSVAKGWGWLVGRACCLFFGSFRHCGRTGWTVGQFEGRLGAEVSPRRCSVATAGEPWFALGFEGAQRRAEASVVAGAKGWGWLVGRACCLLFGGFRHCGRCIMGRFGWSVGRCVGLTAGEPWLPLECEGVRRRAEASVVAGGSSLLPALWQLSSQSAASARSAGG
jgi:hypothetical protein